MHAHILNEQPMDIVEEQSTESPAVIVCNSGLSFGGPKSIHREIDSGHEQDLEDEI